MAFVWGAAGEKLTPQQVERKRDLIKAALARAGDTSPVGHWTQGLARVVEGFGAYRGGMLADKAEKEGRANARAQIEALLGGGPAVSMSSMGGDGGWTEPPPVVEGGGSFPASLIESESGGNWNALNNEMGAGGVAGHGGRLQFGNARLQDAARAGVIPPMTPQQFAQAAPEVQQAVERWHFADIDNQAAKMGLTRYIGQEVGGVPVTQDAIRSMAHLGGIGGAAKFLSSGGRYNPSDSFGTSLSDYGVRHGGGRGYEPSSMASRGADGGMSPVMQALLQASADPWVAQEYGPVIQALMGQEQARQQFAMQQADPLRQLQLQKAQLELEQMRNPAAPKPIEVGGVLLDPTTYQPIFDSRQPDDPIAALRARAAEAGLQPGTSDYAAFMASGGKPENGMVIESDGQGGFRMVQGAGAGAAAGKPFTESQSKDNVFSTRARGALEVLEPRAGALTSRTERAAEYDPTGFARGFQSDDFQVAKNAGDEFLQAILRKDTGAAITEPEQRLYGTTYLPQPGDKPAVLEAKRAARQRAVAAIESGMSPAQMLAQERALQSSSAASLPGAPPESAPVENVGPMPKRLHYNPQTGRFDE